MISEECVAELLKNEGRRNAFIDYVRATKYSVEREIIAAILGFDIKEEEKNAGEDGNSKMDCRENGKF